MAHYRGTVVTDLSVDELFAYMADVRHFAEWDPGTRRVSQIAGDGPGVGARYRVEVEAGLRTMVLPYTMTTFEAPHRVVLQGQTQWLSLRDEIVVTNSGDGAAAVTYDARVELQGALRVLEPVFGLLFQRTGERGASGLVTTLGGRKVDA
jgi:hypothetical protein